MKRTIKLAVVAALALGATSAFATNGATMIAVGAKAMGMGATGIGVGHGAESTLANPALITTIKGNNEVSFGGTIFMPDVETDGISGGTVDNESKSDFFVIPSVSLATKVNDNFYWGIGMWGTGGLGVDYRDDAMAMNMVTALQTMQFGVPLAYTSNGFSVGVTPIVQYSSLDIQYTMPAGFGGADVGAGTAQDVALGYNLGLAYETNGITIGAVYKSEIKFNIDNVLTTAMDGMLPGFYTQTEMATPAEMGVGISYTVEGHTLAVDYKNIAWEDAEVYQDFGWEDQDVIAIGYEYATDGWAVRAGYQYAEGAVQDNAGKNLALDAAFVGAYGPAGAGMVPATANLTNTMNQIGFPGTQESHVTVGGTYAFNETLSMDLAAVFALENKESFTNFMGQATESKHSEQSYSVQLNYAF